MEMAGRAADGAHSDDAGKQAFVTLEKFGAEAAQPGYGGGLPRQILEAQAGKRGGVGEGGGQTQEQQADQETDPEKFSALGETHYWTSRAPVAAVLSRFVF